MEICQVAPLSRVPPLSIRRADLPSSSHNKGQGKAKKIISRMTKTQQELCLDSFSQTRSPNVMTNALEGDGGRQNGQDTRTVYGPNGPQMSPVAAACQPCSQLGATSCSNFPNAKCFDDVCGGCKARFFVPRPGASNPFAEVTSLCISATGAGESFPLQDTSNRIQPYR
jgi:hypothetical protein